MKVLVINCVSDKCEIGLYKGLLNKGIDIDFILDPQDSSKEELESLGARVEILEIKNRADLKAYSFLKERIVKTPYDVIFAPTSRVITLAVQAAKKIPSKLVTYRGTLGNLSRLSIVSRFAHLHPRIDSIIANSDAVKNYLSSVGVPSERLATISKGHDPAWYSEIPPADLQQEFGIPKDAITVSCLANIRPLKGIDILLKAAANVSASVPIHYLLIGDKPDDSLPNLANDIGIEKNVHFTGFRKDALSLLKASDITTMPSVRREGVPRAIAESMAFGIPSIVSNIGGLPELVSDGETGLVVPAKDVDALASALEKLIQSKELRASLGKAAKERLVNSFSMDIYVGKVYELFLELLSSPR